MISMMPQRTAPFRTPEPPVFSSPAEERQHRKQRLAASFRLFSRFGFDQGVAGHITARDPERLDHFWVNPYGQHFGQVRASDLILVNEQGEVVEGDGGLNRAAFAIHSQVHAARPDVVAAAHAHSMYGKAWSSLGRLLDPITQESCSYYNDQGLFEEFNGIVYQTCEGARIAQALGPRKAVVMRNHGLLTVGHSVDEAAWWFIDMERCCQAQMIAESVGKPILIDPANAALTHSQLGTHEAGWLQFQPLWARITKEQPDLFD